MGQFEIHDDVGYITAVELASETGLGTTFTQETTDTTYDLPNFHDEGQNPYDLPQTTESNYDLPQSEQQCHYDMPQSTYDNNMTSRTDGDEMINAIGLPPVEIRASIQVNIG